MRPSLFLWLLIGLCACSKSGLDLVAVNGETMGTYYHVKLVGESGALPEAAELQNWADAEFARINQSMSTYIGDSELSLLNTTQGQGWLEVSSDLMHVLMVSQRVSQLSDGAFDITVMPLVNLWGFGPAEHDFQIPTDEEIQQTLSAIGYQKLVLDPENSRLQRPNGVTLDLSAVAKGFAADAVGRVLADKGYANYMVEVGGELALHGVSPRGGPWRIGVEKPEYGLPLGQPAPAQTVELSGVGMATSGDYRNYYELNGERYSHTIDPLTGRPIKHKLASVTVIAESCALADAMATALNVLGPEKGYALAAKAGVAAYFIVSAEKGFTVEYTDEFKQYLRAD